MTVDELYDHIRLLPRNERLRLLAGIAQDLAQPSAEQDEVPQHSLLELEGMGQEICNGIDAQTYVNELRKEWDHRL